MKKILALAAVLAGSSYASACPTLTGSYGCKLANGTTATVTISQDMKDNVTIYTYNGAPIAADNQVYNLPDDVSLKQGTMRSWCDDDITFKTEFKGKFYNENTYFGDLDQTLSFSKTGEDLKQAAAGQITNSGGTFPMSNDVTCTKTP